MKRVAIVALLAVLFCCFASTAEARKRHRRSVVVHVRPLPVAAHRVLPPYLGRHVYAGAVQVVVPIRRVAPIYPSIQVVVPGVRVLIR